MVGPGERVAIEQVVSLIDLTDLDDAHRPDGITGLLAAAARHGTAAVCVWPEFVARSVDELAGSGVRIATVANFPTGDSAGDQVHAEVSASLADGADEIDLVLPWRRFVDGDTAHARDVVEATADVVHAVPGALLKVILESGDLPGTDSIAAAAHLAIDAGADFVKTSTGKSGTGATTDAVSVMLDVIAETGGRVGIKPSGGVRTAADALVLLKLASRRLGDGWVTPSTFRFGASGLLDEALAALDES